MLLCLSEEINQQLVQNLKKTYKKSDIKIEYGNEKLDTILSLVNSSQNSQQTIGNTHNGFRVLACIITERFDNTLKDQSNYYFRE